MASLLKKKNIDATEGPIFSKMVYFVVPLMLTNLIQQFYTIADNLVVGKYSTDPSALGAIGSSASLVALLTALFTGFSTGAAATVAHDFGARDRVALTKSVHTASILSLCAGLLACMVGSLFAEPILVLMNTKEEFLEGAVVYMRIRCIGMPFVALYGAAGAILRSVGDSGTPLRILTVSGLVNVGLNVVFVTAFDMSSDGVALATLASQVLSVVCSYWVLIRRRDEEYSFSFSKLKFDSKTASRILKYAIPGTIQGSIAHVMNLFISTSVNIFSPEVVEAKTVAGNIDNILSTIIATYGTTAMTFTGQNRGARKADRIKRSLFFAILQSVAIAVIGGAILLTFRRTLIGLFLNESNYDVEAVTEYASTIMRIMLTGYIITGVSNSLGGFLKGMGHSLPPMVISLVDMGIVRVVWIFFVFPHFRTLEFLYYIYPISWTLSALSYVAVSLIIWRKDKKKLVKPCDGGTLSESKLSLSRAHTLDKTVK